MVNETRNCPRRLFDTFSLRLPRGKEAPGEKKRSDRHGKKKMFHKTISFMLKERCQTFDGVPGKDCGTALKDFKKKRDTIEYLALVTQVGLTMAGSIALCFMIGYFLDKWLGTRGLFLVVFIILGIVGGAVTVYRQISQLPKE